MYDSIQLSQAETALQKLDPVLGAVIELQKPIVRAPRSDYFFSLCRSIIGQQVSVAAASAIFARFESHTNLKPESVLYLDEGAGKEIGLSRQKLSYLRDLASHFVENPEIYAHLEKASDEEVIADLTKVKGIGVWTAQMFLMFTLLRLDVFAPDDVGLQTAMKRLYNWETLPPRKELEKFAERWQPYRTIACWHLWQSLNTTPQ